MYEEVRKHLKEMVEKGDIKCSESPWASAAVLVKKMVVLDSVLA